MGQKRVSKGTGSDIQGLSTVSGRGSMQEASMRSERGRAQSAAQAEKDRPARGGKPTADDRVEGYKYASRDTFLNRVFRPGRAAPTVYIEKSGGRAGGRGKRVN